MTHVARVIHSTVTHVAYRMRGKMYSDPENWCSPLVALIGLGMARGDLSINALRWIDRAEVLAGGRRHLELFPEHSGEKIILQAPLEQCMERIEYASRKQRTAVLASGDPFFYGIGQRLVERLGKDRIAVFPNITTVQALFARLGEPWENVKVISLHGRRGSTVAGKPPEGEPCAGQSTIKPWWLREIRSHRAVAFFTDPRYTPEHIARELCDAGMTDGRFVVGEDLGLSTEKMRHLSPEEAAGMSFSPLNLVALIRNEAGEGKNRQLPSGPVLGLPESAFEHEGGLITKMEVRAVVLAHLQLEPDLVLWDLGAASGSVSIEASRLTQLRRVIAVERHPARFQQLLENVKHLACSGIRAMHGNAVELLDSLPDPDRVFIGGSGGDLPDILEKVVCRLRPGGRVVQTAVTLDTLAAAGSFWQGKPFATTITQLQINRSSPLGKTVRFDALNPIFIISAWRE